MSPLPSTDRRTLAIVFCLAMATSSAIAETVDAPSTDAAAEHATQLQMLIAAQALIQAGRPADAIAQKIDPVLDAFERKYAGFDQTLYSSRSLPETLFYMASFANHPNGKATALDSTWGDALYLKAYALIDLKRLDEAEAPLVHAVTLAPMNARYLAELGQLYAYRKDWTRAGDLYRRAAHAAEEFSIPALRTRELTRAWRGIAFVDVELGALDEAAALYDRCIALDPADRKAIGELGYVRKLQASRPSTTGQAAP